MRGVWVGVQARKGKFCNAVIVSISECMMSQMLVPSLKTQQWEWPQTHALLNSIKAVLKKLTTMSFQGCRSFFSHSSPSSSMIGIKKKTKKKSKPVIKK